MQCDSHHLSPWVGLEGSGPAPLNSVPSAPGAQLAWGQLSVTCWVCGEEPSPWPLLGTSGERASWPGPLPQLSQPRAETGLQGFSPSVCENKSQHPRGC